MRLTILALAQLLAAAPAPAQTTDDFEAALRANAPALGIATPGATVRPDRYVGRSAMERPAARPGTIPAQWRTLKAMPEGGVDLQTEVAEGRLDPLALMEQISGPLPLPAGALPVSCGRLAGRLWYTMGVELSPTFADRAARMRRGQGDPQDVVDMAAVEAKPIRDQLRTFFLAKGFREITSQGRRTGFINIARQLRVYVDDTSGSLRRDCLDMPHPIELPTGPLLRFEHADKLGLNERFVDDKSAAPAGQRVTHPFG
jgi:hypothetical protein